MAFAEDLLEQAQHLARREKTRPKRASLRRAVSTAYYALFHLLITEATFNWKRAEQRHSLARAFEHGKMKSASDKQVSDLNAYFNTSPKPGHDYTIALHLRAVAETFVQLQQNRQIADYGNSAAWTRTEVLGQIDLAVGAFHSLKAIRKDSNPT